MTANVIAAAPLLVSVFSIGQARKASLVPSVEWRVPSRLVSALSGPKVTEAPQDLERLLLCFEQGRGVGPHPTQGVGPLGARRAQRVQPEGRRIEKDALALDLLDHRSFGEDVFERLTLRQAARVEVEASQFGERMIVVTD